MHLLEVSVILVGYVMFGLRLNFLFPMINSLLSFRDIAYIFRITDARDF